MKVITPPPLRFLSTLLSKYPFRANALSVDDLFSLVSVMVTMSRFWMKEEVSGHLGIKLLIFHVPSQIELVWSRTELVEQSLDVDRLVCERGGNSELSDVNIVGVDCSRIARSVKRGTIILGLRLTQSTEE